TGGERDEANRRRVGERVTRRHARGHDDREWIQRGREDAAEEACPHPARQGEQGDGNVEEVAEAEAGRLEQDEGGEDDRVAGDRDRKDQASWCGGRRHQAEDWLTRTAARPSFG